MHDWLFVMKQCKIAGYENYDLEKAATIMAEVMKTVMENPKYGGPNKLVHYSMYEAVRSKEAQDYWDNGKCDTPRGSEIGGRARERALVPLDAGAGSGQLPPARGSSSSSDGAAYRPVWMKPAQ